MAEVTIDGVRLHVQHLGEGPRCVLFLHGLVMDNLSSWYFTVANPVAKQHQVLLYDLRGHGRSEVAPTGYRLEDLVRELVGLLDHYGIPTVEVVGHSFGGTLALAFAMLHPERCEGLVLLDPLVPNFGWGERMAATLSLDGADAVGVITERFSDWMGRHSTRKRTRLEKAARALVEGTTLLSDLRSSRAWAVDDFRSLTLPVRMVNGASSDVRPQCEQLAAVLPDCEVRWIEGTHSLLWERTDTVRDTIMELINT